MQARDFIIAFARSKKGIKFDAVDKNPVYIFFGVVSPPYDDKLYLQVYKKIAMIFKHENAKKLLLEASNEHEIIRLLSDFDSWDDYI
jgi:mannitol/fructose-specific phosphotransferase system IIA component (Ntr-type)